MGEQLVSEFLEEVIDEMSGRSTAKWAVALLAFAIGAAVAMAIVRRRGSGAQPSPEQSEPEHIPA